MAERLNSFQFKRIIENDYSIVNVDDQPKNAVIVFLDDIRVPEQNYISFFEMHEKPVSSGNTILVKSVDEFKCLLDILISNDTYPSLISFDHDLLPCHYKYANGKQIPYDEEDAKGTGLEAAEYFIKKLQEKGVKKINCDINIHSMNDIGKRNIYRLLKSDAITKDCYYDLTSLPI